MFRGRGGGASRQGKSEDVKENKDVEWEDKAESRAQTISFELARTRDVFT